MLKKKERDGYVYVSPKTNREYHLLEGMSLGDESTSDIVFIFDYQNDIDEDANGEIVGWFWGAAFSKDDKETEDTVAFYVDKYEKNKEINIMENKKEIRTVSPTEFITKWNEMKKYWVENDGDMDENSYYNRIINQEIYIELPLLGIKANFGWCPPTVEEFDEMFGRMIEDEYFDYLVEKESCFYTGGGFWLSEVPFVYGNESLVMVVDNENPEIWSVFKNVLKDNGSYESVEHDELVVKSANANEIEPDWQIYYIKALQLLANRCEYTHR